MSVYARIEDLQALPIWEGLTARMVHGDRITLAVVELEPNSLVPEHQHEHEQVGIVVQGSLTFTVDGKTKELGPGGNWVIRGNLPHEARAGRNGAVLIETWSPPRGDFAAMQGAEPKTPRWPPR